MLQILPQYSLQGHNTLAVDVKAQYFAEISSLDALREALKYAKSRQLPILPLGGGSNIVLKDDYPGLVLHILLSGIELVDEGDDFVLLQIGAGENWHRTVEHCLNFHYWGLENLSLIPGSVGAAPIQNIGAYGVELKDIFYELQAMEISSGVLVCFDRDACNFGYRDSVFKGRLRDRYIITSVTLKLKKEPELNINYPALQDALKNCSPEELTPQRVSHTVSEIRRAKLPDPNTIPNVGSFFKNPVVDAGQLADLRTRFPEIPAYVLNQDTAKIAAGWLIDNAGMKGTTKGSAGIHPKQALVLTNQGRGSGEEVLALADDIVARVESLYGIQLEMEPRIYP